MNHSIFTPSHRGGSGSPMVLLHGFADTWRTWELVLPALERDHDVLALTLAGHAGGPPIEGPIDANTLPDAVERMMDAAGFERAHLVGSSLGGYVALQLAARGRGLSVVALAPAGGWVDGDPELRETLEALARIVSEVPTIVPFVEAALATPQGRRRATALMTERYDHIPVELLAHQLHGTVGCAAASALTAYALREGYPLDAASIDCPARIIWGLCDQLLRWPRAAVRYRRELLPHADWIELDGVGHCPQLDVPLETAQLILGFAASA